MQRARNGGVSVVCSRARNDLFLTPPRALRQVARRAAQRAAIAAARDTGEGPHAEIHNLHFLVMRKVLTFDFWP
jgi:hypothetical protein